ncbi:MAG: hypothetical protein QGG90_12710, partial [Nitrospinota bacterium]|nr:hypothetical protein [Nitrospinota bacterium]
MSDNRDINFPMERVLGGFSSARLYLVLRIGISKPFFQGGGAAGGGKKDQNGGIRSFQQHKRPYR